MLQDGKGGGGGGGGRGGYLNAMVESHMQACGEGSYHSHTNNILMHNNVIK